MLKIDGVYAIYDTPSQDDLDRSTEYYLGGHIYDVTAETAQALADDGFADQITGTIPATYTILGTGVDGSLNSANATYVTARTGGTITVNSSSAADVGQNTGFTCWEAFVAFDTSTIPDWATITSATLSLFGKAKSGTAFTLEARLHDWGAAPVATDDWVSGASLDAKTLLASMATGSFSTSGYNALASDAAFLSSLNLTGSTRMVVGSSRHRAGTQPSALEYVNFSNSQQVNETPRLVVEALV